MPLFNRKKKVPIQIIKTESLKTSDKQGSPTSGKAAAKKNKPVKESSQSEIQISILGKQQLKDQLSAEQLQDAAEQAALEISRLALPQIVLKAQEARMGGRLDEAILILRQYQRRFASTPEVEDELSECLATLEDPIVFQKVSNGQLAVILFDAANFAVLDKSPLQSNFSKLLETRITFACEDVDLGRSLELLIGQPLRYYCYCLAEFDRALDMDALVAAKNDFENRERSINSQIHFAVCKESRTDTNMMINVNRYAQGFTTIPLERAEIQRTIVSGNVVDYLQSKISAWTGNYRLFATTLPVTRQGDFFGRKQIADEIMNHVNRGNSFYLVGNRRMGKTSLIKHLHSLGAFRKYLYAYVDSLGFGEDENFDRAIRDIRRQWSDDLYSKDRNLAEQISSQIREDQPPGEQVKKFLDQLHNLSKGTWDTKCLVIFDDMNELFYAEQDETSNLWQRGAKVFIRSLHHTWTEMVIVGSAVWDFETLGTIERDLGNAAGKNAKLVLGPLDREDCQKMIEYIGGIINMRFETESLDEIYFETGGHPLWTRLVCDLISRPRRSRSEKMIVTPMMVHKALEEFISTEKAYLEPSLANLKPIELKTLEALANASDGFSFNQAAKRLHLPENETSDILFRLSNYGWIQMNSDSQCFLKMHLLTRYWKS